MSNMVRFEERTFDEDVVASTGPVVVDFYADWCGPCKMIEPVLDQLATEYEGRLKFGRLDVDASQDVAMRYNVMAMPTVGFFHGGKMVDRLVGYPGPSGVRAFLERNFQLVSRS